MTPERWERLKVIFQGALEQPPAERSAWLSHAFRGDDTLLEEAHALLRSHETAGNFLEEPAVVDPSTLLEPSEPLDGADVSPPLARGTRLGAYEILNEIARGGMGVVYLAQDARLGRLVALKALPSEIANRAELRERLRREAQAAATIAHPAVATVYALEELDGHLLIASEYVRGQPLRSLIERGPIDVRQALAIATNMAQALVAAHDAKVVHRDLKPENVLVTADGSAKIVDFGIAYMEGLDAPRLTRTDHAIGTPAYMAPEQLLGTAIDARTDIYAFGVVLLEMLHGRHPMAPGADAQRGSGSAASPRALSDRDTRLFDALVAIANRCSQSEPAARYASAHELLQDLERRVPTDLSLAASGDMDPARRSALWWWKFHQLAAALAYIAMLYPVWLAREIIEGIPGRAIFIVSAAAVIVTALLRWHLWFTSRSYPAELDWVRGHAGRWVYAADWLFVIALTIGALLVGERSALDVVLISMAIGAAVAFLVIEPVTTRAAFGSRT